MKANLNKIIVISIALIMAVGLTACGKGAKVPKEFKYKMSEYVKLPKYEGLKYKKATSELSEEEIDKYINTARQQAKKVEYVKTGEIESDSTVKIDYKGKIDGKEFEGGTAKNVEMNIAKNSFIDGFASSMVGHKIGETFDINVTFPADYTNKDLAGKEAVFTIDAKSLVVEKVPEFDDDFVKKNSKFKTTEEYEENVRKILKKDKDNQAMAKDKQQIFNQISSGAKIKKYPSKELEAEKKNIIENLKKSAQASGFKYEDYLKQMGMTEKDIEKRAGKQAKASIKDKMVIYALADELDVKLDKAEYNKELDKMLKNAGYTKKSYKKLSGQSIEEYADKNNLYIGVLYDKVMDKVIKKSVQE